MNDDNGGDLTKIITTKGNEPPVEKTALRKKLTRECSNSAKISHPLLTLKYSSLHSWIGIGVSAHFLLYCCHFCSIHLCVNILDLLFCLYFCWCWWRRRWWWLCCACDRWFMKLIFLSNLISSDFLALHFQQTFRHIHLQTNMAYLK